MSRLGRVLALLLLITLVGTMPAGAQVIFTPRMSPLRCDGTNCTLASGQMILGGNGSVIARTDAQLEIQGINGLLSMYQTTPSGSTTAENGIGMFAQDSAGTIYKTASISSQWASKTAGARQGNLRFNAVNNAGDVLVLKLWGENSAGFFTDSSTGPGPGIVWLYQGNMLLENTYSYKSKTAAGTVRHLLSMDGGNLVRIAAEPDAVQIANQVYVAANGGIGVGTTAPTTTSVAAAAPAIIAGSGAGLNVSVQSEFRRVVHKVVVTYQALAAAGLTADKTIATLPAKTRLVGIVADTATPYTGGGVTAANIIVGKSVGGNEYLVTHDVFSAPITRGLADADLGTAINRASAIQGGDLPSWSGTTAISVRLTTVTANTNQLTAGSTTYYLVTESMP